MNASNYERWADLSDRAAIGETLSAVEEEFLREHAALDPLARAETELWASMADLGASENEVLDRALANRAVESARRAAASKSRRSFFVAGGALAAAAAVVAFVSLKNGSSARVATGVSVVEYLGGEASADGVRLVQGSHVAQGAVVEAVSGPVCVAVEPRIHTCLASGAKMKLSAIGVPERHVELLAGRVAAALFPLPKGERFSVVAGGVWSTAVGTAFTVEIEPDARIQTIVHEGKVAVGPERGGNVVSAHKIGLSHGEDVTVEPLVNHEKTETPEWKALASVAQRSIEAPIAEAPAETAKVEPAVTDAPTAEVATELPKASPRPLVTKVAPPAADLLAEARQALRDQRWSNAASAYKKLIEVYPSSPEARTVAVPLAKLEIDRLGQPAAALPSLDAYIASGGTLAVEARSARIRAYRALGRSADELRAIDEFLAAHPSSLEAEKLRARADELRGR